MSQGRYGLTNPALSRIDRHAGAVIRQQRQALAWTQQDLADRLTAAGLPVTRQAVQKYEAGETRISLSSAWLISILLFADDSRLLQRTVARMKEQWR